MDKKSKGSTPVKLRRRIYMADFEAIIKKYVNEDGSIPASAIKDIVEGVKTAVGNEFVGKERYKAKLTEIDALKDKLSNAEDAVTTAEKWKTKYEESEKALTTYKEEQTAKETRTAKEKAYKALLKEVGISEKFRERAMKGVSYDDLELDESGKFVDSDKLTASIKKEWGDCIATNGKKGAETATPPNNTGGNGMTKEEILAIKDTAARQKAMYENKELFM